ncbi:MAG TPA: gluconokinase [Longimicrobium sp.]|jgi:gluconokinase
MPLSAASRAPWVLALDAGSSSVRAGLYDRAARPLEPAPLARVPVAWHTSAAGAMETDPEALLAACCGVIDRAVEAARAAEIEVAAVSLATFWHGVTGVGADGAPLTPLFGWGDTRAREDAQALRERVHADAAHRRTGCFLHESYPAAKLLWLRRTRGDTFPRVAAWLSIGELLGERLFGVRRSSLSIASGTGLFDLRALHWDAEMLDVVGVGADRLPEVAEEPFRGLLPEFARRWPELADVPWLPALGDGACATLGSGAVGPGRIALTVGTSAAVRVLREGEPVVPDDLWCYRLDARRTVAGRALSNAGNVLDWLRRTFRLPPPGELEAALAATVPGAHGLEVVPALVGERPPLSDLAETASMAGMTLDTAPAEIARAWMEAVAARIAEAVRAVERAFGPAAEVVASGGALHASPAFARIVGEAVGRPLRLRPEGEETARGAALVALERIGAIDDAVVFAGGPGGSGESGSGGSGRAGE